MRPAAFIEKLPTGDSTTADDIKKNIMLHMTRAVTEFNERQPRPSPSSPSSAPLRLDSPARDVDTGTFDTLVGDFYRRDGVLILDEAHLLWPYAREVSSVFKGASPRVVAFSAASEANVEGKQRETVTPPDLFERYFWHPPQPDFSSLREQCGHAGVPIDGHALKFVWRLCGGHRGLVMRLLEWLGKQQLRSALGASQVQWSLSTTAAAVMGGWGDDAAPSSQQLPSAPAVSSQQLPPAPATTAWKELLNSRAVKANGNFTKVQNIPRDFARVLCAGGGVVPDDAARRALVVAGLVTPQQAAAGGSVQREFQHCDSSVQDDETPLVVPNTLMRKFYFKRLKAECALKVKDDRALSAHGDIVCADLLCRAFPHMDVGELARDMQDDPVRSGVTYEAAFTRALNSLLPSLLPQAVGDKPVSVGPATDGRGSTGEVDTYFAVNGHACAMECAHFKGGDADIDTSYGEYVRDHLARFSREAARAEAEADQSTRKGVETYMKNYWDASFKCTWFLRYDTGADTTKLREALQKLDVAGTADVEVVAVLVSPAFTAYTLFVRPARSKEVHGPFVLPVDFVPRKLVWCGSKLELEAAQSYVSSTLDRLPPGVEVVVSDGRSSFPVTPAKPTVMHLKKAIKVERAPRLDHIAADRIVIKLERDGAALGDEDDLRVGVKYFFEAPPKQ
jgi:hypothetical protein